MSIKFYMDHNVPRSISNGLRIRSIDVLTCLEDDSIHLSDPEILDRANSLNRIVFTMDFDFLVEAKQKTQFR